MGSAVRAKSGGQHFSIWIGEIVKGLPIGRARWFETKWEQLWIEAEMFACDYDLFVGVDSVDEYFVMSGDAEEDSLLGRELDLARDFVRYKYPVTLPKHYNPPDMPSPKGDMVVVAMKAQRETKDKAVVWVEFLSPPSHKPPTHILTRSRSRRAGCGRSGDITGER